MALSIWPAFLRLRPRRRRAAARMAGAGWRPRGGNNWVALAGSFAWDSDFSVLVKVAGGVAAGGGPAGTTWERLSILAGCRIPMEGLSGLCLRSYATVEPTKKRDGAAEGIRQVLRVMEGLLQRFLPELFRGSPAHVPSGSEDHARLRPRRHRHRHRR